MKSINWKDILKRAAKTFVQTFLSYITIDGVFGLTDTNAVKLFALTTGISALAAGISAVWNLIMEVVGEKAAEAIDNLGNDEGDESAENHIETVTVTEFDGGEESADV